MMLAKIANIHQDNTPIGAQRRHINQVIHTQCIYCLEQEPIIDTFVDTVALFPAEEGKRRKGRERGVQIYVSESAAAAAASHDL